MIISKIYLDKCCFNIYQSLTINCWQSMVTQQLVWSGVSKIEYKWLYYRSKIRYCLCDRQWPSYFWKVGWKAWCISEHSWFHIQQSAFSSAKRSSIPWKTNDSADAVAWSLWVCHPQEKYCALLRVWSLSWKGVNLW